MLPILFPGFISCVLQQKLEKKDWTIGNLIPVWGVYTLIINSLNLLAFRYIFKNEGGWMERFANNDYVIHYLMLSIVSALVLPLLKCALNPLVSIRLERKEQKDKKVK